MTSWPAVLMSTLWAVWMTQAVLSALQVRKFARLPCRKRRDRFASFRPPVSVIVPFKGVDRRLAAHVRALCEQDYPDYELLMVVDSDTDPAHRVLTEQLARYPKRKAQVLVAGRAGVNEGQKVHNQLFAIDHITARPSERCARSSVWVFADSDAVPGRRWLADLVGPLCKTHITGVTTGYRWLVPTRCRGGTKPTLWSHLASIINSSVACSYGHDAFNHAWGGSMALTAETAKQGDLRRRLVGALCDDYQFSRTSRALGRRVYFVPWCLVATPVDFDLRGLINFAHRQYLLTRVYAPKLFLAALALTSLYVVGWASAWGGLSMALWRDPGGRAWWWPAGVMGVVFLANQARASFRRRAIERALGRRDLVRLRWTLWLDRWATPVWMTLHWLLILRSAMGRTMRWRGISYRLFAPQRVENIG